MCIVLMSEWRMIPGFRTSETFYACFFSSSASDLRAFVSPDGQHKFTAVVQLRVKRLETNTVPPDQCQMFRCKVIKQTKDLRLLHKTNGREQALPDC